MLSTSGIFALILLIGVSKGTESIGTLEKELPEENAAVENIPETSEQFNVPLNFTNVGLKNIPNEFMTSQLFTYLTFEKNQIESLSDRAFDSVPNLIYLNLADNQLHLKSLENFERLKNLQTLNLDGNCGGYYGCNVFEFSSFLPNLKRLYLRNNNVQLFRYNEGSLPELTHLYITDKKFMNNFHGMWSRLSELAPQLMHIYLENSQLHSFEVSLLPNIISLNLSGNRIQVICKDYCGESSLKLRGFSSLESLSANRNQISQIEGNAFQDTINLFSLDLSENLIENIREGVFDGLEKLENLYLDYNKLVRIDSNVLCESLNKLEILWLNDNRIVDLSSDAFENVINLRELDLKNNRLLSIESGTFLNSINLRKLSLAGNWLSIIPIETLPNSGSLHILDLGGNLFENTQDIGISNYTGVSKLILKENPLKTITFQSFSNTNSDLRVLFGNACYQRKPFPSDIGY